MRRRSSAATGGLLPAANRLLACGRLTWTLDVEDVAGARIERATYKSKGEPLSGRTIVIDGLAAVQTDVLLLIPLQDGTDRGHHRVEHRVSGDRNCS